MLIAAYDPLTIDAEHQLVERVMIIGQWSVKGIVQIESMMREAKARINALEKKTKQGVEPGMMKVFMSICFNKLDNDTKRYCQKEGGRESFAKLTENIKLLRDLDKSMASNKTDVSSLAETGSHAEFVAWQDAGCPECNCTVVHLRLSRFENRSAGFL